jgi:hypothetical protein
VKNLLVCLGLLGSVVLAFGQWDMEVLFDRSGRTDSAAYGSPVIPLGDQNNDGYTDWAVGANYAFDLALLKFGYIEIFLGGNPVPQEPIYAFQRPYNYMVDFNLWGNVGDVNGDGYDDFYAGGGSTLIRAIWPG